MDNLRELQLIELNVLKETLKVFEKNGISYYALGGTMLGAVRHHGFIPWDDDIDIGVPREDYERLSEISAQLPTYLKLCSFAGNPDYPYYFSRIEDARILVRSNRAEKDELTPAWIDVFPLDGMPNNPFFRKLHGCGILIARMLFQISRFDTIVNTKRTNRPASEKAIIHLVKVFHIQKWVNRRLAFNLLDKLLTRFSYVGSDYQINAMGAYKLKEMFHKNIFGEGQLYPFEDIQIRGPEYFEIYLSQLYGNWKIPADLSHHEVVDITINN